MKQQHFMLSALLDLEMPEHRNDIVRKACKPVSVEAIGGAAVITLPFEAMKSPAGKELVPDPLKPKVTRKVIVQAYGTDIVRISLQPDDVFPSDDSVMLEWDDGMELESLSVQHVETGWRIVDRNGRIRMDIDIADPPVNRWDDAVPPPYESFRMRVFPDGQVEVPFTDQDCFLPNIHDALPLVYVERDGKPVSMLLSLYSAPREAFAGTGERFAGMNLSGRTLNLENEDAMGNNNRRAYKNVPFYVSNRPYGLFMHTSAHIRLSLADLSTRAVQAAVDEDGLDLFFVGGGNVERIVYNYKRITGFPHQLPPVWSFGTWMARMSYYSREETEEVARKLREGDFPCDIIHQDTGWFPEDWKCDWTFSKEKYPDPAAYMQAMREQGFRISLWQLPWVGRSTTRFAEALSKGYIVVPEQLDLSIEFTDLIEFTGCIDFTNSEAVAWYKGMLAELLQLGASVIKTDFGESILMEDRYAGMPASKLHNLYALLYQKAAYEATQETTGEGIIWARAGWAGCQRYPVHWSGDVACTWDGLAGTIRGGLHFGLSGFTFWSHDVPGFQGVPDFMGSWPEDDLYVRWTQVGVFTSHLRYHGCQPREPYEYPNIAPIARKWLKLRYALIPYVLEQSRKSRESGYPVLRALLFHHESDPYCWHVDDQYYFGEHLLVAPILNREGVRDVYLPAGEWVDVWTGEKLQGPRLLKQIRMPLERMPLYAVYGSSIPVYPDAVSCTDEMELSRSVPLVFDETYEGLSRSIVGQVTGL